MEINIEPLKTIRPHIIAFGVLSFLLSAMAYDFDRIVLGQITGIVGAISLFIGLIMMFVFAEDENNEG